MANWCKEVIDGTAHSLRKPSDRIDFPDYPNYKNSDGSWKCNIELDAAFMVSHGYSDWTEEQEAAWHEQYDPEPVITVNDYDNALEAHLTAELTARGYTTRSPIEYTNSKNTRWAQDAKDWQTHLDAVMEYGLDVMNRYAAGETVPTLAEFKAALPKIAWTVALA